MMEVEVLVIIITNDDDSLLVVIVLVGLAAVFVAVATIVLGSVVVVVLAGKGGDLLDDQGVDNWGALLADDLNGDLVVKTFLSVLVVDEILGLLVAARLSPLLDFEVDLKLLPLLLVAEALLVVGAGIVIIVFALLSIVIPFVGLVVIDLLAFLLVLLDDESDGLDR